MTDSAGKVVFANEAAITGLGLERGAVPGLDFLAVLVPGEREKGRLALREAARSGELPGIDLWMRRQNGETFPVELSAAALGEEGDGACIVTISRDMSDKRRAERELRSRLMAYMLEEGNVYLVKETAPSLSQAAYEDLLAAGFRGAVLSRTPPEKAPLPAGQPAERKWLAERPGDNVVSPRADAIERWVAGLPRNRAVLVDRLDYVISKNGFRSALHLVHRLRELAFLMGHAMILSIDPATVAERDLRALEKEAREVLPRTRPDLPRDELEALRFVFERELSGTRPSLSDLGRGLGLSKPTARKRVRDLARYGYLVVGNRGRSKLLELTESGRRLFSGN
jgi:PAS domain S-box-containing protein